MFKFLAVAFLLCSFHGSFGLQEVDPQITHRFSIRPNEIGRLKL